jgi:hypothetical protein
MWACRLLRLVTDATRPWSRQSHGPPITQSAERNESWRWSYRGGDRVRRLSGGPWRQARVPYARGQVTPHGRRGRMRPRLCCSSRRHGYAMPHRAIARSGSTPSALSKQRTASSWLNAYARTMPPRVEPQLRLGRRCGDRPMVGAQLAVGLGIVQRDRHDLKRSAVISGFCRLSATGPRCVSGRHGSRNGRGAHGDASSSWAAAAIAAESLSLKHAAIKSRRHGCNGAASAQNSSIQSLSLLT